MRTYVFVAFLLQNLRDALDCIYDAKVPKIWGKVQWVIVVVVVVVSLARYDLPVLFSLFVNALVFFIQCLILKMKPPPM